MLLQRMDNQIAWSAPHIPELPGVAARQMWYDTVGTATIRPPVRRGLLRRRPAAPRHRLSLRARRRLPTRRRLHRQHRPRRRQHRRHLGINAANLLSRQRVRDSHDRGAAPASGWIRRRRCRPGRARGCSQRSQRRGVAGDGDDGGSAGTPGIDVEDAVANTAPNVPSDPGPGKRAARSRLRDVRPCEESSSSATTVAEGAPHGCRARCRRPSSARRSRTGRPWRRSARPAGVPGATAAHDARAPGVRYRRMASRPSRELLVRRAGHHRPHGSPACSWRALLAVRRGSCSRSTRPARCTSPAGASWRSGGPSG